MQSGAPATREQATGAAVANLWSVVNDEGRATVSPRRWWGWVLAMAALGAVARFAYVMAVSRHVALGADATWYYLEAGLLADGRGYVDPEAFFRTGASVATGNFPPLYPAVLAGWQTLLGGSETASQLAGVPLGVLTVVLAGVLGRRLAGARVGVVGLAAARRGDRPRRADPHRGPAAGRAAGGAAGGVGCRCHAGAAPRLRGVGAGGRRRARALAGAEPLPARRPGDLDHLARHRAGRGQLRQTYFGRSIGSWEFACTHPERRATLGERAWGEGLRAEAMDYARSHLGRLALVLPARELRAWGLWDPGDLVRRDVEETRVEWFQWIVRVSGVVTLVAGLWGMWWLRDRGPGVLVLLAPVAMVAVTALVSHGNPRFRTVAEPELLVGCAVVAVAAADRVRRARGWRT